MKLPKGIKSTTAMRLRRPTLQGGGSALTDTQRILAAESTTIQAKSNVESARGRVFAAGAQVVSANIQEQSAKLSGQLADVRMASAFVQGVSSVATAVAQVQEAQRKETYKTSLLKFQDDLSSDDAKFLKSIDDNGEVNFHQLPPGLEFPGIEEAKKKSIRSHPGTGRHEYNPDVKVAAYAVKPYLRRFLAEARMEERLNIISGDKYKTEARLRMTNKINERFVRDLSVFQSENLKYKNKKDKSLYKEYLGARKWASARMVVDGMNITEAEKAARHTAIDQRIEVGTYADIYAARDVDGAEKALTALQQDWETYTTKSGGSLIDTDQMLWADKLSRGVKRWTSVDKTSKAYKDSVKTGKQLYADIASGKDVDKNVISDYFSTVKEVGRDTVEAKADLREAMAIRGGVNTITDLPFSSQSEALVMTIESLKSSDSYRIARLVEEQYEVFLQDLKTDSPQTLQDRGLVEEVKYNITAENILSTPTINAMEQLKENYELAKEKGYPVGNILPRRTASQLAVILENANDDMLVTVSQGLGRVFNEDSEAVIREIGHQGLSATNVEIAVTASNVEFKGTPAIVRGIKDMRAAGATKTITGLVKAAMSEKQWYSLFLGQPERLESLVKMTAGLIYDKAKGDIVGLDESDAVKAMLSLIPIIDYKGNSMEAPVLGMTERVFTEKMNNTHPTTFDQQGYIDVSGGLLSSERLSDLIQDGTFRLHKAQPNKYRILDAEGAAVQTLQGDQQVDFIFDFTDRITNLEHEETVTKQRQERGEAVNRTQDSWLAGPFPPGAGIPPKSKGVTTHPGDYSQATTRLSDEQRIRAPKTDVTKEEALASSFIIPYKEVHKFSYKGRKAIAEVEKREDIKLTDKEKHIVKLEGFVDRKYYDKKKVVTYGVGQTGEFMNKTVRESIQQHEKELAVVLPKYSSLHETVQKHLLASYYRGMIQLSPRFQKLFNTGKFTEAADEFLRADDYLDKDAEPGVKKRMEATSDAVRGLAT